MIKTLAVVPDAESRFRKNESKTMQSRVDSILSRVRKVPLTVFVVLPPGYGCEGLDFSLRDLRTAISLS